MPNPPNIQIALQGGGAKLSALIAAMEAVQNLHRGKHLNVTRIAGTSAGAIVACLFAANVDLGKVRERLKRFNETHWKTVFPEGRVNAVWKLSRGKSLWSEQFFEKELEYFFAQQDVKRIEEIYPKFNIQPILVATDLRDADKKVYTEGNIVKNILDSCGLPYCFRVWNQDQSPVIVDGGVCENLPSDELIGSEKEFGSVFGVSFREETKQNPNSIFTFTYALLDAAISHSVKRAKASLGNDRVFEIKTKIRTFDFPYAFSDKSDDEYSRIYERAHEFFTNLPKQPDSDDSGLVTRDEWSQPKRFMERLGQVFESHFMNTRLKYVESSLEVTATSLTKDSRDDYVKHTVTFRTLEDPVYCLGFSLNADHDFSLEETKFKVFKKDSLEPLETTYLPSITSLDEDNTKSGKRLMVFFLPALPAQSGDYVISLNDVVKDFMKPLRDERNDSLSITPYLTDEAIDKFSIVLHVPKTSPDVKMIQAENLGHQMNSAELASFSDLNGFKSFGWTAPNVSLDQLPENNTFKISLFFSK